MTAQDEKTPIMFKRRSDSGIDPSYLTLTEDQWFRNLGPSDPFRASKNSLDFSLQLANGLVAFNAFKQAFNATGVAPT